MKGNQTTPMSKSEGTWVFHRSVRQMTKRGEMEYIIQRREEDGAQRYARTHRNGKVSIHYRPWW